MRRRGEASGASRCEMSSFRLIAKRRPRKTRGLRHDRGGNFPACKALKTHKMGKESRFFARPFHGPAERPAPRRKARRAGGAPREPGVLDPVRESEETPSRSSIF